MIYPAAISLGHDIPGLGGLFVEAHYDLAASLADFVLIVQRVNGRLSLNLRLVLHEGASLTGVRLT